MSALQGVGVSTLGQSAQALEGARRAVELLRGAGARETQDLDLAVDYVLSLEALGQTQFVIGDLKGGRETLDEGVQSGEIWRKRQPKHRLLKDSLARLFVSRAEILRSNNLQNAAADSESAVRLLEELLAEDPNNNTVVLSLGRSYVAAARIQLTGGGAKEEQLRTARRAVEYFGRMRTRLGKGQSRWEVWASQTLAQLLWRYGGSAEKREALARNRQAVNDFEEIYKADPQNPQALQDLQGSYATIGGHLTLAGRIREAEMWLRKAVEMNKLLVGRDPGNRVNRRNAAVALLTLGANLRQQGDVARAIALRREGGAVYDALIAENPTDRTIHYPYGHNRMMLAQMLAERGDRAEADRLFQSALDVRKKYPAGTEKPAWLEEFERDVRKRRARAAAGIKCNGEDCIR